MVSDATRICSRDRGQIDESIAHVRVSGGRSQSAAACTTICATSRTRTSVLLVIDDPRAGRTTTSTNVGQRTGWLGCGETAFDRKTTRSGLSALVSESDADCRLRHASAGPRRMTSAVRASRPTWCALLDYDVISVDRNALGSLRAAAYAIAVIRPRQVGHDLHAPESKAELRVGEAPSRTAEHEAVVVAQQLDRVQHCVLGV